MTDKEKQLVRDMLHKQADMQAEKIIPLMDQLFAAIPESIDRQQVVNKMLQLSYDSIAASTDTLNSKMSAKMQDKKFMEDILNEFRK